MKREIVSTSLKERNREKEHSIIRCVSPLYSYHNSGTQLVFAKNMSMFYLTSSSSVVFFPTEALFKAKNEHIVLYASSTLLL